MKNVDCVTLENNKDYIIVEEIRNNDFVYIYLTCESNPKDFCVRKLKNDILYGLDDEKEFQLALNLIKEKNKKIIEKLNLE